MIPKTQTNGILQSANYGNIRTFLTAMQLLFGIEFSDSANDKVDIALEIRLMVVNVVVHINNILVMVLVFLNVQQLAKLL